MDALSLYKIIEETYTEMSEGVYDFSILSGQRDETSGNMFSPGQGREVTRASTIKAFDRLQQGYEKAIALENLCNIYQDNFPKLEQIDEFLEEARHTIYLGRGTIDLWRDAHHDYLKPEIGTAHVSTPLTIP